MQKLRAGTETKTPEETPCPGFPRRTDVHWLSPPLLAQLLSSVAGITCLGIAPPTVGGARLQQCAMEKMALRKLRLSSRLQLMYVQQPCDLGT